MRKVASIAELGLILLFGARTSLGGAQMDKRVEAVKVQVQKIGVSGNVTVILLSGDEYYGAVTRIDTDQFEIDEVDLKKTITFKYSAVKKLREGYGAKHSLTGKRMNPRTRLIVGLAVVGGLLVIAVIGASQTK